MTLVSSIQKLEPDQKLSVCVLGAGGYTGLEVVRLLHQHPKVKLDQLCSRRDKTWDQVAGYHNIQPGADPWPPMVKMDKADFTQADVIFSCLPHGVSGAILTDIDQHYPSRVLIDLSADLRLKKAGDHQSWYGDDLAPGLRAEAVYGFPELDQANLAKARVVANPGCYPTCALLALAPLRDGIDLTSIVIDAKSAVSGAGRALKESSMFCQVAENITPYSLATHRHCAEIEQYLGVKDFEFTPQVIAARRGMLATIYVQLKQGVTIADLHQAWDNAYRDQPLVRVLLDGIIPTMGDSRGTNGCALACVSGRRPNSAIIVSTIDNLGKGAAGQAIQAMNLIYGFEPSTGLISSVPMP